MFHRLNRLVLAAGAACLVALAACAPRVEPATMVLRNGKIVTVDAAKPEAQALAIRDDRIVAVGTEQEIAPYIGDATEVIDLHGQLAVPGLIDSHLHFTGIGQAKLGLDLTTARTWDDIVKMVADAAAKAKPGAWIVGRGWHQEKWDTVPEPNVDGFPVHDALSKVSPDNPVLLTHASGHATFANAKAMALAGVTRRTPDPEGGQIIRDKRGNPIGVFTENAAGLIRRAYAADRAKMTDEERAAEARKVVELADRDVLSKGLTSVDDAGSDFATIDLFKTMVDEGKIGVRLYVMARTSNEELAKHLDQYRMIGYGDDHLTVRAIKVVLDGALGSRSAWMLEPYSDLPSSTGVDDVPLDVVRETAKLAIDHDYQLCIHAIGDRANREVLNIYEETFKAHPDKTGLRWRDEHTQHLSPQDIPRFGQLGVIASMQGIHCTSDAPYVIARLGEKRAEEGAYVWQKLMKSGAMIANGTDAPVEDEDPIPNFYASVTRQPKSGPPFFPDQKMTRMEALESYTINGAYAAFQENEKGSLVPGKLADVTVLSKDIMTIPDADILTTQVTYTIVGGKVLYKR